MNDDIALLTPSKHTQNHPNSQLNRPKGENMCARMFVVSYVERKQRMYSIPQILAYVPIGTPTMSALQPSSESSQPAIILLLPGAAEAAAAHRSSHTKQHPIRTVLFYNSQLGKARAPSSHHPFIEKYTLSRSLYFSLSLSSLVRIPSAHNFKGVFPCECVCE